MKRLRAGVIGVGHLGQHHARHYATLPGSILVGVCDAEASRAKLIADRHGVQAWTDLDDLLKNVERRSSQNTCGQCRTLDKRTARNLGLHGYGRGYPTRGMRRDTKGGLIVN